MEIRIAKIWLLIYCELNILYFKNSADSAVGWLVGWLVPCLFCGLDKWNRWNLMRRLLLLCSCTSTFPEAKHHTREPNDTQTHTKPTPVKQTANSQMQKNAQQDETHETCKQTVNLTFRHSKISEFDTSPNQNSVQDGCGCPFWLWPSRRIQVICKEQKEL